MSFWFWQVIKDWQPLIAGALGFTGVMLTLRANAKNQERLEALRRKADVSALRAGLASELMMLVREAELHLGFIKDEADDGGRCHLLPFTGPTPVFDAAIPRLGFLTAFEIATVMRAYQDRSETRSWAFLASEESLPLASRSTKTKTPPAPAVGRPPSDWQFVTLLPGGAIRLADRLRTNADTARWAVSAIQTEDPSIRVIPRLDAGSKKEAPKK